MKMIKGLRCSNAGKSVVVDRPTCLRISDSAVYTIIIYYGLKAHVYEHIDNSAVQLSDNRNKAVTY